MVNLSFRVSFAKPSLRGGAYPAALAAAFARPNESMRQAISLGLKKLAFVAQKERFTGKGPFPVAQNRLGVVSGRLRRDLHAEPATLTERGYTGRIGSVVEYFGAHEVGFSGRVQVPGHTRKAVRDARNRKGGLTRKNISDLKVSKIVQGGRISVMCGRTRGG